MNLARDYVYIQEALEIKKPFLAATTLLFATLFMLLGVSPMQAQHYKSHDDCGRGQLRNQNGSCGPMEQVLSTGGARIFWVAQRQSNANDRNPGTKQRPWKTISRATRAGVLRPGDAVIVRQGVYRESIRPKVGGTGSNNRITFAAYTGENVVVTGADLINGAWTRSGNAWKHTWRESLPVPMKGAEEVWRREMIIVDGKVLRAVYNRAEVVPGTFFVEGSDTNPRAIYVRLPNDSSPNGHTIQAAKRQPLFSPADTGCSNAQGVRGWYRLIGFTFRHAANYGQHGAICPGSKGSLFEENTVEWSNGTGIKIFGADHTLRGNRSLDNGMAGISGTCNGCLLEYNESSRNNWKGYNRAAGGGKWVKSRNMVFRHHLASDNEGEGIWFDDDNDGNVVESSMFINNRSAGIMLELRTVRTIIRNNVIYGTRWHQWRGAGLLSQASNSNVIVHNTFMANEGMGLRLRLDPNRRAPEGNNTVYNNLFIANAATEKNAKYEIFIDDVSLARARTNRLDGNLYWPHDGGADRVFFFGPDPSRPQGYRGDELNRWQKLTGGDRGAEILSSAGPLIKERTSDGWQLVANSQARGQGASLPSNIQKVLEDINGDARPSSGADVGADQYAGGSSNVTASRVGQGLGEAGVVTVNQSGANQWHTVRLNHKYADPVVILSPASYNGQHPIVGRVRDASSSSFTFQLDEWDYLDGAHTSEKIGYLVVEAGRHVLEDGRILEAGHAEVGTDPKKIGFTEGFSTAPVVLSQVVTLNEPTTVITRQTGIGRGGFNVFLQTSEAASSRRRPETVAWVALEQGAGEIGGSPSIRYEAGVTGKSVGTSFREVRFAQRYDAPVFLAAMQSAHGMDPAALRFRSLTKSGVEVMVEEEQSRDTETSHTTENAGYLTLEAGPFTTTIQDIASKSSYETANVEAPALKAGEVENDLPKEVALMGNYPNPFNPQTTIRYALPDQVKVTLEVFDLVGRRLSLLVDEVQAEGSYEVTFRGEELPSGVYIYRLRAGSSMKTGQMTLLK
jgi:hypothetical protein